MDDGWTAEIAIPFTSLGFDAPPKGKTVKANLARSEKPHGENSTWNACYRGFLEPYSFGNWTFVP